jgi:hypothetical protein
MSGLKPGPISEASATARTSKNKANTEILSFAQNDDVKMNGGG